jgi:hypothetical protein
MKLFFAVLFVGFGAWAGVDEPKGCWLKQQSPCAYRAESPEWLHEKELKIFTGAATSLIRQAEGRYQLLQGRVWIESESPVVFQQGSRSFEINGHVWLEKSKEKIRAFDFKGETKVSGEFSSEILLPGFENWWDFSTQGVLKPFATKATLGDWNRWLKLESKEAAERIAYYKMLWKDRFEAGSEFYRQLTERRLASIEEKEDLAHQRELARKKESEAFRRMLRQRLESR